MKKLALLLAVVFCLGTAAAVRAEVAKTGAADTSVKKVVKVKKVSHKKGVKAVKATPAVVPATTK